MKKYYFKMTDAEGNILYSNTHLCADIHNAQSFQLGIMAGLQAAGKKPCKLVLKHKD